MNRTLIAGWSMLGMVALLALLGALDAVQDPADIALFNSLSAPDARHWLGTDLLGRDALARLVHGTQYSVGMALAAALSAAVPGVLMGLVAASRGGAWDRTFSLLADSTLAVPGLLLVLLVASIWPGHHLMLYLGLSLFLWVEYFKVARAVSAPLLRGPAVEASRLLGLSWPRVVWRHLSAPLASVLGPQLAFSTAQAVLALAALGFIGVGLRPPAAELGLLMTEALPFYHEAPWLMGAPVAVLLMVVLGMMWISEARHVR